MSDNIKTVKINNHVIKQIPNYGGKTKQLPVLGGDIIAEVYANISMIGRKMVGKTSTLYHILTQTLGADSYVYIFSHTINQDKSWINIKKWLKRNDIEFEEFTEVTGNLEPIIELLRIEAKERRMEEDKEMEAKELGKLTPPPTKQIFKIDDTEDEKKVKEKKKKGKKWLTAQVFFIFDDISDELRIPAVSALLKENRHWLSKVIMSSQEVMKLDPASRKMTDVWLIYRGEQNKLPQIYKDAEIKFPYELFEQMYEKSTNTERLKYWQGDTEKILYNFFYIDKDQNDFRSGFTDRFIIPDRYLN